MHRTAPMLTACLLLAVSGAAWPYPETGAGATAEWGRAGVVPARLPLVQERGGTATDPGLARGEDSAPDATAAEGNRAAREIVAGVLTGSLAAVLMLKLLFGRRRRNPPRNRADSA